MMFAKSDDDIDILYKRLKLLKVLDLIYIQNCILMCRVNEDVLPLDFCSQFKYRNNAHDYETRASSKKLVEIPNFKTHQYSFLSSTYQCLKDWNKFLAKTPEEVLEKMSSRQIRTFLTKELLSTY